MLDDKTIYSMVELKYKEINKNVSNYDLFPFDWYSCNDFHLMVLIISDAIKNNVLIKDSNLYKEKFINEKES